MKKIVNLDNLTIIQIQPSSFHTITNSNVFSILSYYSKKSVFQSEEGLPKHLND
jgi:hypothetical protein